MSTDNEETPPEETPAPPPPPPPPIPPAYVRISDGRLISYEGMSEDSITAMLAESDKTCEFLTKEEYDEAVEDTRD